MRHMFKLWLSLCLISLCTTDLVYAKDIPERVAFFPYVISVPEGTDVPAIITHLEKDKQINLLSLSQSFLASLTQEQLNDLLTYLGKYKVKLQWVNADGETCSGRAPSHVKALVRIGVHDHSNAAAAIMLKTAAQADRVSSLPSKILAAAPSDILRGLKSDARNIFTAELVTKALGIMFSNLVTYDPSGSTRQNNILIIKDAAKLSDVYVKHWAKKDIKQIKYYLKEISDIYKQDALSHEQAGALIGSVLAGAITHVNNLEDKAIRKAIMCMVIGDLAISGLGVLGLTGLSPIVGVQALGLAIPVLVGLPIKFFSSLPAFRTNNKDLKALVKIVQGHIEVLLLQHATPENTDNVRQMLAWMGTALHINGHCD